MTGFSVCDDAHPAAGAADAVEKLPFILAEHEMCLFPGILLLECHCLIIIEREGKIPRCRLYPVHIHLFH